MDWAEMERERARRECCQRRCQKSVDKRLDRPFPLLPATTHSQRSNHIHTATDDATLSHSRTLHSITMLIYIVAAVLVLPIIYILYFSDAVSPRERGGAQCAWMTAPTTMDHRHHQSTTCHASNTTLGCVWNAQRARAVGCNRPMMIRACSRSPSSLPLLCGSLALASLRMLFCSFFFSFLVIPLPPVELSSPLQLPSRCAAGPV